MSDVCSSINVLLMCYTARQKSFISLSVRFVGATLQLACAVTALICVKCVGREMKEIKQKIRKNIEGCQLCVAQFIVSTGHHTLIQIKLTEGNFVSVIDII